MVDDTSVSAVNQGVYVNKGYQKVRRAIAQARPYEFESLKTTVSLTLGIGSLPADYMTMREVQDSDENTLPKLGRNTFTDTDGGSSPAYWYLKGRSSAAGHAKQIGIKPLITTSIYIYYIPLASDLDGTSDELIDLPDEDAQDIGLMWSAYEYYRDKKRWGDASNALALYNTSLQNYLEEFEDNEEEFIGEDSVIRPRLIRKN